MLHATWYDIWADVRFPNPLYPRMEALYLKGLRKTLCQVPNIYSWKIQS
jgi:hypothetical protein